MSEREGSLEAEGVAVERFKQILEALKIPQAVLLNDLIRRNLVRLTTDSEMLDLISRKSSSDLGFTALFDPHNKTTKAVVAIDQNAFDTKGPIRLREQVRDVAEKFEKLCVKITVGKGLEWAYLEDSEVQSFMDGIKNGNSPGHVVIHALDYIKRSGSPI